MSARKRRIWIAAVAAALSLSLAAASVVSASPHVYASGEFSVRSSYLLDLDLGQEIGDLNDPSVDIWYQIDKSNHRLLVPTQSRFVKFGATKPTYSQCSHAAVAHVAVNIGQNVGKWFCAITNEQRVDRFKIVSVNATHVVLKFTTWVLPVAASGHL